MRSILVPTDFSKVARNAIDYAVEIAKISKAKIILFNVYHVPITTADASVAIPSWGDIEKLSIDTLKKIERSLHRMYGKELQIECITQMGYAVEEIIKQYTLKKDIDLVVMGMNGAGYLSERLIGSNATELISKSECPILVINQNTEFKKIKKIVLAYDNKKVTNTSIFDSLKVFAKIFKAEIYILNVFDNSNKKPATKKLIAGDGIEHNLSGVKHSFHFVENKDLIEGINEFVNDVKADMVVFIPRKHRFLDAIFHEGNTKRMAFHTSIPLLTLHE